MSNNETSLTKENDAMLRSSEQRVLIVTIIMSLIGFIMTGLIAINIYFVRSWIEQTAIQLTEIQKDVKSLELRLTEYGATYVTRIEARDIAREVIAIELPAAIRQHEKDMHRQPPVFN